MLEIVPIETPTLGDRSYLVYEGSVGFVIDPQRDIDRVLDLAADRGVVVRHVFETHIHNDYITGGRALANATGATYHVNADDPVTFEREPIADGDIVAITPTLSLKALATPGHTFTHLSYALLENGRPVGVFTGGSLLFGSTGRPDLLGHDATDALAHAQFQSARRLAAELPDDAQVFPTHGFGSFCAATQTDETTSASTIADEKRTNPALTYGEAAFIRTMLDGLDAYPAYYARMTPANLDAPGQPPDLSSPRPVDVAEVRRRIDAGEWVVDLRHRTAFVAGHLPGSFSFGLSESFATYLGWVIPWGMPLTLISETPEEIEQARRELVRIGIDLPGAAVLGSPTRWLVEKPLETIKIATFADLEPARSRRDIIVLDVRRNLEWNAGHVADAVHIPLHELLGRLGDVPDGEVWVHCAAGYRASIAASMLAAAGHDVVLIDDDYDNAAKSGVRLDQTMREIR